MRLQECLKLHEIMYDDPHQLERLIDYQGAGWYSLGDDGVYRMGQFATYSRIKII